MTGIEVTGLYWVGASIAATGGFLLRGVVDSWRNEREAYRTMREWREQRYLEATAYLEAMRKDRLKQAEEEPHGLLH